MSKKLSCGVVVVDLVAQKLLVGHPTHTGYWDLFKGGLDEGESPIDCAVREAQEESGLQIRKEDLIDLGQQSYTPKKDLHLFVIQKKMSEVEMDALHCSTNVTPRDGGEPFPEMDGFAWMTLPEYLNNSSPSMNALLKKMGMEGKLLLEWDAAWVDEPYSPSFSKKKGAKPK